MNKELEIAGTLKGGGGEWIVRAWLYKGVAQFCAANLPHPLKGRNLSWLEKKTPSLFGKLLKAA